MAPDRTGDDELDALASAVRDFCRERLLEPILARPGVVRDGAAARAGWQTLAAGLGVGSLLIGEEYDGAGASLREAGRVAEALGAELATVPFLSSGVLAPTLLGMLPGDAAADLLRRMAADNVVVAVAWAVDDPGRPLDAPVKDFDHDRASGSFRFVIDADIADLIILVGAGGEQIVAVDAADLQITARPSFDLTRGLADVVAQSAPSTDLAHGDDARAAYDAMLAVGRLALAAECAGGARAALDVSVRYARQRVQFGREIGSFQAIKHMLADSFVNAESALSVARLAIDAHVGDEPDATELAAAAAFYCADRYADVAATGIQVHGGIGFTVECAAHLYRRRAEAARHLLGDPARLRADYVSVLSLEEVGA